MLMSNGNLLSQRRLELQESGHVLQCLLRLGLQVEGRGHLLDQGLGAKNRGEVSSGAVLGSTAKTKATSSNRELTLGPGVA